MHLRTTLTLLALTATAGLVAAGCGGGGGISSADDVTEEDVQAVLEDFAAAAEDRDGEAMCELLAADVRSQVESFVDQLEASAQVDDAPEELEGIDDCASAVSYIFGQSEEGVSELTDVELDGISIEEDGGTTYVVASVNRAGVVSEDALVVEDGELRLADFAINSPAPGSGEEEAG